MFCTNHDAKIIHENPFVKRGREFFRGDLSTRPSGLVEMTGRLRLGRDGRHGRSWSEAADRSKAGTPVKVPEFFTHWPGGDC